MSALHETLERLQDTTNRRFYWRCMKPGCAHGSACGSGPWLRVFYDDEQDLRKKIDERIRGER